MKGLFSLSTVAVALVLGTSGAMLTASTTDAQAQAKVTVRPINYEARVPACTAATKGLYRTQQDGFVFVYGYCLSNITWTTW